MTGDGGNMAHGCLVQALRGDTAADDCYNEAFLTWLPAKRKGIWPQRLDVSLGIYLLKRAHSPTGVDSCSRARSLHLYMRG